VVLVNEGICIGGFSQRGISHGGAGLYIETGGYRRCPAESQSPFAVQELSVGSPDTAPPDQRQFRSRRPHRRKPHHSRHISDDFKSRADELQRIDHRRERGREGSALPHDSLAESSGEYGVSTGKLQRETGNAS